MSRFYTCCQNKKIDILKNIVYRFFYWFFCKLFMKIVQRMLFLYFALLLYGSTAFGGSPQTCGFTKQCPDGLACVGSVGTANTGICVLTGPQIVLCKVVIYFDGKLVTIFAIFAVVMIGIAFFLGKISWGMIISVILGLAMTKGAVTIIKKISGQDDGYCTSDIISYSSLVGQSSGTACVSDLDKKQNTTYVYNVKNESIGTFCTTPLTCFKKTCTITATNGTLYLVVNNTYTGYQVTVSGTTFEGFVPDGTIQLTTAPSSTEFGKGSGCRLADGTTGCQTVSATCTAITKQPTMDYFYCKNTCTNSDFAVYYEKDKYKNCQELSAVS